MKGKIRKTIIELLALLVGSAAYASALYCIMDKNHLAPGGISGISVMVHYINPKIDVGTTYLVLNIPILILGFICLSRKFMVYTLISTGMVSGFSNLLSYLAEKEIWNPSLTDVPILAALYGGAALGVGVGIVMRGGGSTGGTDILAKVVRLKNKQFRTGPLILCADAVVITASAFVFRDIETALYAGVGAVVSAKILDLVLYGSDETKKLLIVSEHHEAIAQRFMKELDTGVTYLDGRGAYTGEPRTVMLCMVKKHLFTKAREIVTEEDKNAFLIISSASEVFGEGYKRHESEDL
ncbi:MAG: YitT family protein [Lachnospiraceae bacterium]|nr:YitT family protein [Lachnospiraceae bacterium]